MVRVYTVAAPKLVIMPVFSPTYAGILALDDITHIWHATITNLDSARLKDLA